jgi:hypothetical protein
VRIGRIFHVHLLLLRCLLPQHHDLREINPREVPAMASQVLPEIYDAQLFGYLDGLVAEPEKEMQNKDKDGVDVKIPNP